MRGMLMLGRHFYVLEAEDAIGNSTREGITNSTCCIKAR